MADQRLQRQLTELLQQSHARISFDRAVAGLPPAARGRRADGVPHTAWRLLEHLRIAQCDILEFSRDGRHKSPQWPDEYWPAGDAPPTPAAWDESLEAYRQDREAFIQLIQDPDRDLLDPIPHSKGQTLLREAILLIDHEAYHLGQLILLRRALGEWREEG